jgi:hypothetical protein
MTPPEPWVEEGEGRGEEGGRGKERGGRVVQDQGGRQYDALHTEDSREGDPRAKPYTQYPKGGEGKVEGAQDCTHFSRGGQGTGTMLVQFSNRHLWVSWGASRRSLERHVYGPVYGVALRELER